MLHPVDTLAAVARGGVTGAALRTLAKWEDVRPRLEELTKLVEKSAFLACEGRPVAGLVRRAIAVAWTTSGDVKKRPDQSPGGQ